MSGLMAKVSVSHPGAEQGLLCKPEGTNQFPLEEDLIAMTVAVTRQKCMWFHLVRKQIGVAVALCPVPRTVKPGSPTCPGLADPEPSSPSPPESPMPPRFPQAPPLIWVTALAAGWCGARPWPASVHFCPHG